MSFTHGSRLRRAAAAAFLVAAGGLQGVVVAHAPDAKSGIAWQVASSDAEVDRAFALAKQSGKPVFLYWGAVWCPPCNQVKATLFTRADFVERSRAFIPVYVDGDKPGAQKVASRFKVSGYPTMILFKSDGSEVTRLPGEVDPQRYLITLTAGLNAQVPVKELIRKALAKQALTPEQWRLLAYYSWDTDEQQVLSTPELPLRLAELAAMAPAELPAVRDRLALKSIAASAQAKSAPEGGASDAARKLLDRLLADPDAARQVSDGLVYYAEPILKYASAPGAARRELAAKWDAALGTLAAQPGASRVDQLDLLGSRVTLWKAIDGSDKLSAERGAVVLRDTARIVAATSDRYERQAVVPGAADVLADAGFIDESDQLLKLELPRAVAPYYHMLGLAGNAKKRGDVKDALYWYEQAWRKSEGPATRLQWGAGWVNRIIELAPADVSRVESAASAVIAQLEPKGETFYERNERSLKRMAARLVKWQGSDPGRGRVVEKVKTQLAKTCARLPASDAGRGNCESVFSAPASS
jgi:thioredoxin-like negative regulator of GroEL